MDTEELMERIHGSITSLYGSVEAAMDDWRAEEIEELDILEDDEEVELFFN